MARILFAALLLLFTLPAAAQTPGDSIAFVTADWHTTDLGRGAACRYAQVEMFGSRQSISVVSYPARHFATQIVQLDGKGETTGRMGEAADATAAINGSYFNMKTFTPITFVMVDCRVLGRTTPGELMRTNGIIAIRDKQGHDVAIFACDTTQYPRIARRYRPDRPPAGAAAFVIYLVGTNPVKPVWPLLAIRSMSLSVAKTKGSILPSDISITKAQGQISLSPSSSR